jgi:MtaA/CmuA family methyltransferase
MTGKERFLKTLGGRKSDRIPIDPVWDSATPMRFVGGKVSDYYLNSERCAEALIAIQEEYGFDAIQLGNSLPQFVELFGGAAIYPDDSYPLAEAPCFKSVKEIAAATLPEWDGVPNFKGMIETVRLVSEAVGDQIAIGGRCVGTFNVMRELIGSDLLLRALVTDADLVHAAAELACETLIRLGRAYIEAGARYIWYPDATSSPAWISPQHFEEFAMPYHARFFEAMRAEGAPVIYHPCGGEYPILCLVSRIPNVNAFHFSELVDLGVVRQIYGPEAILWGNVHPYGTLMANSPERVVDEVKGIIQKAGKRGRLIMAPG